MKKLLLVALLLNCLGALAQNYTSKQYKADFTIYWNTIDSNYCYFEKKQVDWHKLHKKYNRQIDTVSNRDAFISVMERVMYELYDHHCGLRANTKTSRRLVPTSADMWAEFSGDKTVITEVRKGYGAEKVGTVAGMEVIAINDVPVKEAILLFLAHTVNAESKSFALRLALNGDHVTKRKNTQKTTSGIKDFYPD